MASLSRRTFLVTAGAVGAGVVLAACGGDDSASSIPTADAAASGSSPSGTGDANRPNRVLVRFAADGILAAGKPQRLPVGLGDADGLLLIDTPATFTAQIVTEDGKPVGAPLTVDRHAQDLPRPYYPFIMNITEPGTYSLVGTVDGVQVNTAFSILDASKVSIPQPGDQMVPVVTPTTADPNGRHADLHAPARVRPPRGDADRRAESGEAGRVPRRDSGVLSDRSVWPGPRRAARPAVRVRRQGADGARRGVHRLVARRTPRRRCRPTTSRSSPCSTSPAPTA